MPAGELLLGLVLPLCALGLCPLGFPPAGEGTLCVVSLLLARGGALGVERRCVLGVLLMLMLLLACCWALGVLLL